MNREREKIMLRIGMMVALAKRRRRLGVLVNGCDPLRKIIAVYGLFLLKHAKATSNEKKNRRWWQRPIFADHHKYGAWSTLVPILREQDEDMYFNFMRMTPQAFDRLLAMISPFLKKTSWRAAISPGERLAITLRYLCSGDSQMSMTYLFRVSSQAISRIVLETTTVIWNVLKKVVFPTLTEEFWIEKSSEFQVMWNIPHCIGAIDGKQVRIKAFPHSGSRWFGYKKMFCMTLMAVSDAKHRFLVVESGASGKRSDGNIFAKSAFARNLATGQLHLPLPCPVAGMEPDLLMPFFFAGDNAYGKSQNFATPFKGERLREEERVYNYRLSRARRIVENAFGIMCARFRILFGPIEGSFTLVSHIILACMALHNFHLVDEESIPPKKRKYRPKGYADYVRSDGKYIFGRWRNEKPEKEALLFAKIRAKVAGAQKTTKDIKGKQLAEMLLRYFVTNPVPWQWEKANLL